MLTLQELRTIKRPELLKELETARQELLKVRIGIRSGHEKNTSKSVNTRRYVAHIKTALKELELEEIVSKAKIIS